MKQTIYTITGNREIAPGVWRIAMTGDTAMLTAPGQFIDIALDGLYLRRPISVCDWDDEGLTIIYKVVGRGTEKLSRMTEGEALDCLSGLGNDLDACPEDPVLAGGGVGVPPLYGLAKKLIAAGKRPVMCLGFNAAGEVFLTDEFRALGCQVRLATLDGSLGAKGFVTDLFDAGAYACACGPEPMLKAVYRKTAGGQFSFEARMGCGFGACMGCTCRTLTGHKRICKDGPVMRREEIAWDD